MLMMIGGRRRRLWTGAVYVAADERFFFEKAFCVLPFGRSMFLSWRMSLKRKRCWLKGIARTHTPMRVSSIDFDRKMNVKHMLAYWASSSYSSCTCFHNQPCLMSPSTPRHILRRSLFRIQLYFRPSSTIQLIRFFTIPFPEELQEAAGCCSCWREWMDVRSGQQKRERKWCWIRSCYYVKRGYGENIG